MRKIMLGLSLIIALILSGSVIFAEEISVKIKGIDNGVKSSIQKDYQEALMDAKLKAIERAGGEIHSITRIVNFQMKSKAVESTAAALLMPDFEVVDIGYLGNGAYQIVLIGKIKTLSETIETKELRYVKSLFDRGKKEDAKSKVKELIANNKDDTVVAEALYFSVIWEFADDDRETFEKVKAYYPNFKKLKNLESVVVEREKKKIEWRNHIVSRDGSIVKYKNGVIYDETSNLEWCVGPNKNVSYNSARYFTGFPFEYSYWLMPTKNQLETLWKNGKVSHFFGSGKRYIWSSDQYALYGNSKARFVLDLYVPSTKSRFQGREDHESQYLRLIGVHERK